MREVGDGRGVLSVKLCLAYGPRLAALVVVVLAQHRFYMRV